MKNIPALLLVLVLIFAGFRVWAEKYNVNFNNVPMKDFITFVSEFTGKNVIFNEADIRGNVTVNSQKEMDSREILDIFYSVLKMNGYLPVVSGNNIQIVPEKDIPAFDENIVTDGRQPPQSFITAVISLDYYNAATLLPVLNRMKSRAGYVEIVRGLNILVVKDQSSRINKMTALIRQIDDEANGYKFHTIQLTYAVASKVEQQIIKLYGEMGKNALSTTNPIVVSDDMSNSLIIAATDKEFEKISYLVGRFDSRNMASNTAPKVYYLKNAKAEDVEKVLQKLINSISPAPKAGTAAAPAGAVKANISSDKATNSIIAIGDQELYANLSSLIEKMDIPRRQVYVEALILETSLDKGTKFGVEWFGGGVPGKSTAVLGGLTNTGNLGSLVGPITQGGAPAINNLPSGFSLGVIGDIILYQGAKFPSIGALVSALQSASGVNIVSNPQILTLDNEEAEVFVGENRPYVTSEKYDSNNNPIQTFDYRNVGIRMKITPQISSSDMVTLTIDQEVNKISPATFNDTAPITLTRTTKTTVKLQNKSIMVISGLIKDDSSITNSGIPFLSKIPILGWLFKTQDTSSEKTNLMVFITTQIIDTVEDAKALMKVREDAMKQFNDQADRAFGKKTFTGKESNIRLKDQIEGKVPLDTEKTDAEEEGVKEGREDGKVSRPDQDRETTLSDNNTSPENAGEPSEKTDALSETGGNTEEDEVFKEPGGSDGMEEIILVPDNITNDRPEAGAAR